MKEGKTVGSQNGAQGLEVWGEEGAGGVVESRRRVTHDKGRERREKPPELLCPAMTPRSSACERAGLPAH